MADLKGKRICYPDRSSTTGFALPRAFLKREGFDPDKGFREVVFSGNHTSALRDLTDDKCDVAGTYSGALLGADEQGIPVSRLRVLAITGRTPHDTIVTGPKTARQDVASVKAALLSFDPQEDLGVTRVGEFERVTGFVEAPDRAYADLRAALGMSVPD